jgi:hypothetical protein
VRGGCERSDGLTGEGKGVFVACCEVVHHSGLAGMHGATAEGLRIDHFTESGFDEGWAGEEGNERRKKKEKERKAP